MSLTSFVHRATTVLCIILHRPHRRLLDGVALVPFDRLSRMPRCQRSAVWSAHRNRLQCTFTQRFFDTEVRRIRALNRLPGQRDASPWVRQVHRHPVCSASSSTHTYAGSVQRCRSHVRADRADRAPLVYGNLQDLAWIERRAFGHLRPALRCVRRVESMSYKPFSRGLPLGRLAGVSRRIGLLGPPACCTTVSMKIPGREGTGKRQALNGSCFCDHRLPRTSTPGLSRVRGAVSRLHVVPCANGPTRPTCARVCAMISCGPGYACLPPSRGRGAQASRRRGSGCGTLRSPDGGDWGPGTDAARPAAGP